VTVTGTSKSLRTTALALLLAAAIGVPLATAAHHGKGAQPPSPWKRATISSGAATLAYPATWRAIPGDRGTVSFALRDARGLYLGYLNVTPRQGAERLAGWAAFRTARNAEDGDRHVRVVSSSEHVAFTNASGSCVVDDYLSRVGSHPYRELACIVAGRHSASVFVGAALVSDWGTLAPMIRRSAATLIER
jgi:hypothetical protein